MISLHLLPCLFILLKGKIEYRYFFINHFFVEPRAENLNSNCCFIFSSTFLFHFLSYQKTESLKINVQSCFNFLKLFFKTKLQSCLSLEIVRIILFLCPECGERKKKSQGTRCNKKLHQTNRGSRIKAIIKRREKK